MTFPARFWTGVFSWVLLTGCAGTQSKFDQGTYPSGKPKYRVELDEQGRKHGRETWWYENGREKYRAENDHGVRRGEFRAWYPEGGLWYRGREDQGRAQDTLEYLHPNGKTKTLAVFRDGIQLSRRDFDSTGVPEGAAGAPLAAVLAAGGGESESDRQRREGIEQWSRRVRATVESYWTLPKELTRGQFRSVAKIRVAKSGKILNVAWVEKSPSAAFNGLASKALKKAERFPEFPPAITDADLEIQYEFVTPGAAPARRKLELRGTDEQK